MNALLLAAGLGTRLRPLTDTVPKCMVPIQGRPLLSYWLELLMEWGSAEQVVINTHHLPESVRAAAGASAHRARICLFHEEQLLGTAGTLLANLSSLRGSDALVAHADNLTLFDCDAFLARHRARPPSCVMTMMTFDTDAPQSCGIVGLSPEGVVESFHEKVADPPGRLANAAVYLFAPEALDMITRWAKTAGQGAPLFDISQDIIPRLLDRIFTFHNHHYHRDIGNPAALNAAQAEFPSLYDRFAASMQARKGHSS
jgi:mannose-1-phosphate guanylyltransferase